MNMSSQTSRRTFLKTAAAAGLALSGAPAFARTSRAAEIDDRILKTVREFADNVLREGRDRFSKERTPLFCDGLNVDTREPVRWITNGQSWICSNLASQQNLFRTLVGLSNVTGNAEYREAAAASVAYHFDHLASRCGLLHWGGHRFYDLATMKVVGEQPSHELKAIYPFYEFMHEVNPRATEKMLRAQWNAHVMDWATLDMNRHGKYGLPLGKLWDHEYRGAKPHFVARGLSFITSGSELCYAGGMLGALAQKRGEGEEQALAWARRLHKCYIDARDPKTELGAYQYSRLQNDRAQQQLGPEFGKSAIEPRMLHVMQGVSIYGRAATVHAQFAAGLGKEGEEMLDAERRGLLAYARHGYDAENHQVRALWIDGAPIAESDVKRTGYYNIRVFAPCAPDSRLLRSYALVYRLTGDDELWNTVRAMARGYGLGDWGRRPGESVQIDLTSKADDPMLLFALLEVIRLKPDRRYLELAQRLAENIIARRFHQGMFVESSRHVNASFDCIEPLALLELWAVANERADDVPICRGGRGYIHGPHDGVGRTYDYRVIYEKVRG